MDATISWLSLARMDCYLHGQSFLTLKRKTHALLVAQRFMSGLAEGIRDERRSRCPLHAKRFAGNFKERKAAARFITEITLITGA